MAEAQTADGVFWADVNQQVATIDNAKRAIKGQPLKDVVYITSIKSRKSGTAEGSVVVCAQKLAAQRIVEETHRLSTAGEIADYLDDHEQRAREIPAIENMRRASAHFVVDGKGYPVPAATVPHPVGA